MSTAAEQHSFKNPHCKVNRPRTCELKVAAEYTADLAKAGKVAAPELQQLFQADYVTEGQVVKAIETVSNRLPPNLQGEAQEVLMFVKSSAAAGKSAR